MPGRCGACSDGGTAADGPAASPTPRIDVPRADAGPGPSLPLVDISGFRDPGRREAFLADLRHAAHDVGFFYVTGHGVPGDVTDAVLDAAREFFALPMEQRLEIENLKSPQFRGYSQVGTEHTAGAADQRDQIDVGDEHPALADVPSPSGGTPMSSPPGLIMRGARADLVAGGPPPCVRSRSLPTSSTGIRPSARGYGEQGSIHGARQHEDEACNCGGPG